MNVIAPHPITSKKLKEPCKSGVAGLLTFSNCKSQVGSRLKATHIHNNYGSDDQHLPISLGTIDWDKMITVLNEIGYNGSLSVEVLYPDERFAESYFQHNYQCADSLMNKMLLHPE